MDYKTTNIITNSPPPKPAGSDANNDKIAWGVAIGFHVLLAIVFAFLNVGWRYDIPEWVEMEFASTSRTTVTPKTSPRKQPEPAPQPEKPQEVEKQEEPAKNIISLPKRRMLEDEKPLIRSERRVELTQENEVSGALQRKSEDRKQEVDVLRTQGESTDKAIADLENLEVGEKNIQAGVPDLGKSVAVPFEIEGEAASRNVLQKVIPQYPPGLTREAVVKLRFSVLPNGIVANIVPVLKGDATLEKVAIDAFRQWRFNELPIDMEQKNQSGVITFRFLLR